MAAIQPSGAHDIETHRCRELVCEEAGSPPRLRLRDCPPLRATGSSIVVKVLATSVNPIDVKRSAGYGARLLSLKGAGRFPMVLGNDFAGEVLAAGPGVRQWKAGDRVLGTLPTGARGAHATQVVVDGKLVRPWVGDYAAAEAAVLPYTFTTLWRALRSVGLDPRTASGRQVLVHGASGGLGQLALQVLAAWHARVTAICGPQSMDLCRALGAESVVDRHTQGISSIPAVFDASFNFASWPDDALLVDRLREGAMGHATTVHPLLGCVDQHGFLRGGYLAWRAHLAAARRARSRGPSVRYAWVVYQPDRDALDALQAFMAHGAVRLPIGFQAPLADAAGAFRHVAEGRPGRAALLTP